MSACQLAVEEVPSEQNLHRSMLCDREWGGAKKKRAKGSPRNPTQQRNDYYYDYFSLLVNFY